MAIWHIIPTNDTAEHQEDSTCECEPRMDEIIETGDILIIHNAYDGREAVEIAMDIINNKYV